MTDGRSPSMSFSSATAPFAAPTAQILSRINTSMRVRRVISSSSTMRTGLSGRVMLRNYGHARHGRALTKVTPARLRPGRSFLVLLSRRDRVIWAARRLFLPCHDERAQRSMLLGGVPTLQFEVLDVASQALLVVEEKSREGPFFVGVLNFGADLCATAEKPRKSRVLRGASRVRSRRSRVDSSKTLLHSFESLSIHSHEAEVGLEGFVRVGVAGGGSVEISHHIFGPACLP